MRKLLNVWNDTIRNRYQIDDENLDKLMLWLDENRFHTGERPTINEVYFTIQIYLYRTALFRLSYNIRNRMVFVERPIKVESHTVRYGVFESALGEWEKLLLPSNEKSFPSDQVNLFIHKLQRLCKDFSVFIDTLTSTIRIKEVELKNYRGFSNQKISFQEPINVIIGENGTGKTAILDSIAISIGAFLSGFDELTVNESKPLRKPDIHWDGSNYQLPCEVSSILEFKNKKYSISRSLSGPKRAMRKLGGVEIHVFAKTVEDEIRFDNNKVILPVFAYYGAWMSDNRELRGMYTNKRKTRFYGYLGCLKIDLDTNSFYQWYIIKKFEQFNNTLESIELELLNVIENTIEQVLMQLSSDFTNIRLSVKDNEVVIVQDNKYMPISLMSDGYRKLIGIVADIAWRMTVLNPQLGKEVVNRTPGIVLVDEIDLHLHPKWQRKIIKLLTQIFPEVQFIVTTHSPNIISTIHKDNIIMISERTILQNTPFSYGRDINSILIDLMDTPERSEDVQAKIDQFYELLYDEEYEEADEIIEELAKLMGPNDATIVRAKTMLKLERE